MYHKGVAWRGGLATPDGLPSVASGGGRVYKTVREGLNVDITGPEIKIIDAGNMWIKIGDNPALPLLKYSISATNEMATELSLTLRAERSKISIEPILPDVK